MKKQGLRARDQVLANITVNAFDSAAVGSWLRNGGAQKVLNAVRVAAAGRQRRIDQVKLRDAMCFGPLILAKGAERKAKSGNA
jgi:hypothetical protein